METEKIIISVIFFILGLVFFFNSKKIAPGAAKFYQWLYTEKNMVVMFRAAGIVLIVGSVLLFVLK